MNWSDYVGWVGSFIVLFSYSQVALRRWRVRSFANQFGNFVGSGCLGLNSFFYQAWVPLVLNLVWSLVAVITIWQLLKISAKQVH